MPCAEQRSDAASSGSQARERVRALRLRVLEDLKATVRAERLAARQTCTARVGDARAIKDEVRRARAALVAESGEEVPGGFAPN